ncbi:MAG: DUF4099 domain-containing protein [Prevotella sp.]|nr:DUF4099 domain-containing protein [Prevotella sp.]
MNYSFEENEMPYSILERFGLTQTMIEDLPTDVLQNIYNGRKSPVLPVQITTDDGEDVKARTRFSLIRTGEGSVDVLFYPQLDEYDLKTFNETQSKSLLAGKPIIGHLENNESGKELGGKCFFQLDLDSKQVMSVPTPVIGRNIQYVADRFHLTGAEMQKLQNGEILTIIEDEAECSIGIDLNSMTGLRFAAGNDMIWRREGKREWDKYSFGIFGCWKMDEAGNLDYIPEESYTEEMWNELNSKSRVKAMKL